ELSKWAYFYCKETKNDPEIRKYITDSYYAYLYCYTSEEDSKIKNNITHQYWAHIYCRYINYDPELRKNNGLTEYIDNIMKEIYSMRLELLDKEYKGFKYKHKFRCLFCGYEFKAKYSNLKRREITCRNCRP
ncbi:MAG: hypothetical protein ACOC1O_06190, partial [bacterium]